MARSRISSESKDLLSDDGAVLISIIDGEQIHLDIQLNWLTNLTGYAITSKIVEGLNDGEGSKPLGVKPGGNVRTLSFIDTVTTDNKITLVIPDDLVEPYSPPPKPDKPVYAYIDLEIADTGSGINKQIWKPLRGLVEILYSPSESA